VSYKSATIRIIEDAAIKAGRSLLRDFGEVEKLQVSRKGVADFVSAADIRAEKILMEELNKARPGYSYLNEEGGEIKGENPDFRWIIDPLDGTMNFLHGIPHFSISIGLEHTNNGKAETVAGLVFAPVSQELFWAEKGQGGFVGNERLKVSARKEMEYSVFATGNFCHGRKLQEHSLDVVREVAEKSASIRCLGSAALELAYVAAGRMDGFWHWGLKPWDMAAGILLVQEAKGMVTDMDGGNQPLQKGHLIATNGLLHKTIDDIIAPYYRKKA
jgi:myo-inositol-1(or 4)-monophosphatase